MKRLIVLAGLLAGACAPAVTGPRSAGVSTPYTSLGLERVVGQPAAALVKLFGAPDADVREGEARKLQFTSRICVLDTYLYPAKQGADPTVSYIDAREPDGSAIDRASCVAALTRRDGGK